MYSLPITVFSDYWRTTRSFGLYMSGTVVLLVSTGLLGKLTFIQPTVVMPENIFIIPQTEFVGSGRESSVTSQASITFEIHDAEILPGTAYVESDEIPPGMNIVQAEGTNGVLRQVVKTVTMGNATEQQIIYQFELASPKKKVVIENNTPVRGEPIDPTKFDISQTMPVEATAYTYTGNPTASGIYPREGLIAVDPNVIPLGSYLYVEGYGYAIAADTGGAIIGNKIDVFFPSLKECLEWGRRPTQVFLLSPK